MRRNITYRARQTPARHQPNNDELNFLFPLEKGARGISSQNEHLDVKEIPPSPFFKGGEKLRTAILTFIVVLFFFVGMSVEADTLVKPGPRQGYYFGLGAEGVIDGIYTKDIGWVGPHVGPNGSLHIGQGLNKWAAIGLHLGAGTVYSSGRQVIIGNVSLETKLSVYKNLFIRPSVGFGFADITRRKNGLAKVYSDIGARYHMAVGYDFFPFHKKGRTGGWAFSPFAWVSYADATELQGLNGGIGIEITFWTGLPKNQLDIEGDEAYR